MRQTTWSGAWCCDGRRSSWCTEVHGVPVIQALRASKWVGRLFVTVLAAMSWPPTSLALECGLVTSRSSLQQRSLCVKAKNTQELSQPCTEYPLSMCG